MNDETVSGRPQGAGERTNDAEFLRRYAEEGDEAAFAELVRRHVDLVYGAALRRTGGDAHAASDVAQQVFTTLARQAVKLSRHTVLSAWLHTATRNAALNLMISAQRRKHREREALVLEAAATVGETSLDWDKLRPVLDAAIDELPEPDRAAVVLRFLEHKPFAAIGAILRVSEDAARMRTERALDKLRSALVRRGITSTAAALAAVVGAQPLASAPAGLAAALAARSLAGAGASVGLGATLISFMNAKLITGAAVTALVFFGVGSYVGLTYTLDQPLPPPPELPRHTETIASLRAENARLRADVDRLHAANAALAAPPPARPPAPAEAAALSLSQLQRAMLNNLRQISAARDQFILENGRPPSSIQELVGPEKYIRRLVPVDGEDYSALPMGRGVPLVVTSPNGVTVTYDDGGPNTTKVAPTPAEQRAQRLRRILEPDQSGRIPDLTPAEQRVQELGRRLEPAGRKAMEAYRTAHKGKEPPAMEALIPYFATPQEGADFVEFIEAMKEAKAAR